MATVFTTKNVQFLFKEKVRETEIHMFLACVVLFLKECMDSI